MNRASPIDVLVVDDHPVFRRGLASVVSSDSALRVVGDAGTGAEALSSFRRLRPAVTLMDLRLPDMTGVDAIRAILAESSAARILVVSSSSGDVDVHNALDAGARGYVAKDAPADEVLSAIHAVHAGRRYLAQTVAERLAEGLSRPALSTRELEVLRLIAKGLSNREIAAELSIEESTVKMHVRGVLGKLGVEQRTHAAMVALQRGLIHLE